MALTAEREAELVAQGATPEVLKFVKAQAEILDRHDAAKTAAELKAAAAEKKIADDAEAARLATLSEVEKARAETAKEKKLREDAEAKAKREREEAAVKLIVVQAGAVDVVDVMALLGSGVIGQDEAGVKSAVEALKAKYPPLFGGAGEKFEEGGHPRTGSGSRSKGPVITQAELDRLQDKDLAAWRATRKRINAKELTLLG